MPGTRSQKNNEKTVHKRCAEKQNAQNLSWNKVAKDADVALNVNSHRLSDKLVSPKKGKLNLDDY